MDHRVCDSTVASNGTFKSDGRLEGVSLGAVFNLDVVKDDGTLSPGTVRFKHVCCEDLATPSICIFTYNLDISCEKDNLTAHINSIVVSCCRATISPMVVIQRFVQCNDLTLDTLNRVILRMIVLHRSRSEIDLITNNPVKAIFNDYLSGSSVCGSE